jgi:hypothetical protein
MKPTTALQNIVAAITGEDTLQTGLYLGSYKQHTVLQESFEVLTKLVQQDEEVRKKASE